MREGLLEPFKILFRNRLALLMLISVAVLGFVSAFDKIAIGGTNPQNTIFALFIENVIIIFGMLPYLFFKRKNLALEIFTNKSSLLLLGIFAAISNSLGFIAIGSGNVGIISAIFRTQILFALLFSFFMFKDKPKLETIFGTMLMIAGLIIIKFLS